MHIKNAMIFFSADKILFVIKIKQKGTFIRQMASKYYWQDSLNFEFLK